MDNQQGDYDENVAQDAGYIAGRIGKHTQHPWLALTLLFPEIG